MVIRRPAGIGGFQFAVLATLRAQQLIRGCRPLVGGLHKKTVIAQLEVGEGLVTAMARVAPGVTAEVAAAAVLVDG